MLKRLIQVYKFPNYKLFVIIQHLKNIKNIVAIFFYKHFKLKFMNFRKWVNYFVVTNL